MEKKFSFLGLLALLEVEDVETVGMYLASMYSCVCASEMAEESGLCRKGGIRF